MFEKTINLDKMKENAEKQKEALEVSKNVIFSLPETITKWQIRGISYLLNQGITEISQDELDKQTFKMISKEEIEDFEKLIKETEDKLEELKKVKFSGNLEVMMMTSVETLRKFKHSYESFKNKWLSYNKGV
ncbi:hypothetical protein [Desulfurella sp.]|uniref:hypothetical protein n=1 Tax=Desulfurella sp. TaxID=1962857 RepID=UPI0025BD7EF4|nr:hypothetical protein [Desulfurella sp.]